MHELGIVFSIINTVEKLAIENHLTKVHSITLQVGELSGVVPKYLKDCYPAAIYKSDLLHDTKLKIEFLKGRFICNECGEEFNFKSYKNTCPCCGSSNNTIIDGKDLIIKQIEGC